jgi:Protein of unknown function (DUF1761)
MGPVPINYLAVVVAAIAGFLTGWGWYSLFGKVWLRALGKAKGDLKPTPVPFILSMLANLLMAYILAGVIGHVHVMTVRGGVISALFVWAGFVATTTVVTQQFEGQKPLLTAIDVGHWLAVLVVMGVIIGLFGA